MYRGRDDAHLFDWNGFFFDFGLDPGLYLRFDLFLDLRFDFRLNSWCFGLRCCRRYGLRLNNRFNLCNFVGFDRYCLRHLDHCCPCRFGDEHTKLLAELFGETVFDSIGMRCYRHAHVLEFANDLGIVAIQFTG
jgi:hypothetical protein